MCQKFSRFLLFVFGLREINPRNNRLRLSLVYYLQYSYVNFELYDFQVMSVSLGLLSGHKLTVVP